MKTLFFLVVTLCLLSCNPNDEPTNEAMSISSNIDLIIKNNIGQDLLSTLTPNTLNSNDIKLYYLINGQVQEVYNAYLNNPRNYLIYDYINTKAIRVFLNDQSTEEYPIAYLKWNNTDTDTIKCHFNRGVGNDGAIIFCDKVWYNNKLVYPTAENQNTGRYISLIK